MWKQSKDRNFTIYKKTFPAIDSSSVQEGARQIDISDAGDQKVLNHARSIVAQTGSSYLKDAEIHIVFDNKKIELILKSGSGTNRLLVHLDGKSDIEHIWETKGYGMWILDGVSYYWNKVWDGVIQPMLQILPALLEIVGTAAAKKLAIKYF